MSFVFKDMFTSVLRHELSHSTHVATFKAGGMPMRSNDAGLGSPLGAAAHPGLPGAGRGGVGRGKVAPVTHPTEKGVEMCLSAGVQDKVAWRRVVVLHEEKGAAQAHPNLASVQQPVLGRLAGSRTREGH